MNIGDITAALMELHNLTQEGLAARVRAAGAPNVKYQHIQQLLETPTRRPRYLPELARAFDMSVEQFLDWTPAKDSQIRSIAQEYAVKAGLISPSQPISPELLAAGFQLVRMACVQLGTPFDPETPEDATLVILGCNYLRARDQQTVTTDNLVDFTKALRERRQAA